MDKSKLINLKRRIKEQCSSHNSFPSAAVSTVTTTTSNMIQRKNSLTQTVEDSNVSEKVSFFNDQQQSKNSSNSFDQSKYDKFSSAVLASRHVSTYVDGKTSAAVEENAKEFSSKSITRDDSCDETSLLESNSVSQSTSSVNVKWICNSCSNQCLPVIRESRCLCGHRMKEHSPSHTIVKSDSKGPPNMPCAAKKCKCQNFLYVVAEGSWVLRCRCKHKHIEHDCSRAPFTCLNQKCVKENLCQGFDSPWVCNCGHTWSTHSQIIGYTCNPSAG